MRKLCEIRERSRKFTFQLTLHENLILLDIISSSLVSEPAEGPGPDHKPHERPTIPEVSSSAHLASADDDQVYEKIVPVVNFSISPCKLHVEF